MKLSDYARKVGITYKTAYRWYKAGRLKGYQVDTGTIIIEEEKPLSEKVVVYARVSSSENRDNLASQAERLTAYCMAKGYQVQQVVKEVGSGVNDSRPKFLGLLADTSVTRIVVEHKDRATRFGFRYLETLLEQQHRQIEVVNLAADGQEDLLEDLVAVVYSFCARLYGPRRAKRKTERITAELAREENDATG
jgi:putative resolvase